MKNKVSRSIEAPGGMICVDIFQRPDRSWGFEEYRREPEDGSGWFRTGYFGDQILRSEALALEAAIHQVAWLQSVLDE